MRILIIDDDRDLRGLLTHYIAQQWPDAQIEPFNPLESEIPDASFPLGSYDVVILDCSPLLPVVDTRELIPQVDAVVLCVRTSRTTRSQAHAAREALARLPARPTGIVLTGIRPRDAEGYSYYYSEEYAAKA